MNKGKKDTLHEALITGTVEDLKTAAAATGRPIRHVVSHPNGAFATDLHGPSLLKQLAKAIGQDQRPAPSWDDLTREEKDTMLRAGAGSMGFIQTGLVPRATLCQAAAGQPAMVKRLFPKYARDSQECQLGLLEGCGGTGKVECHIPSGDLYSCAKCTAKEQHATQRDLKR